MKYAELIDYKLVPLITRIPKNLRDSAKEAAALLGMIIIPFLKRLMN